MIEFKQAPHTARPTDVVEVWVDGEMLAVIYPHGDDGIKVISMHVIEEPRKREANGLGEWSFRFKRKG